MSQLYDLQFNKDDVILRNIIVGVLATLNNKMWWYQQTSQTEKQKVNVPFYFSTTGDERFLMDMFMNTVSAGGTDEKHAEAVYNQLPRAILQMDSLAIDAGSLTNKFVRAFYQRIKDDGTLTTFNSEVFMVPLILTFTVDLYVDSNLDVFKGMQRTIEVFYKHNLFQIDVDGTRIPAVASLPEDFAKERPIEFTFGDKKEWKINYQIQVQTFMPIFKNEDNGFFGPKNTEMPANTVMDGFMNKMNVAKKQPPANEGKTTQFNKKTGKYEKMDPQPGGFTEVTDPFVPTNPVSNPPTDAWPDNPSGYSNPLPPNGGATGSTQS